MTVTLVGPEPSGLAAVVSELIERNLARDPGRRRLLRPSVAVLQAEDADVEVFLRIGPDGVRVGDGLVPDAHVRIRSNAEFLLALTTVPLRFGLPDPLRPEGRAVIRELLTGRLRVGGLLTQPIRLARLTQLLSVVEGAAG